MNLNQRFHGHWIWAAFSFLRERAKTNLKVPWRRRSLYVALFLLAFLFIVPPVWQLKEGPISVVRWPKSGERVIEIGPNLKTWTPINRVSRHVLHAFIVAEDGRFYEHPGIDWEEIVKSLRTNIEKGRYARGGSTITQQVVKMAFLSNKKTLSRKVSEALGALLVEKILSKDEILAWYINLAEFGDGIFGLREAAWHHFKTKPETLTIQHGAHLALVLPSPNAWSKGLRQKRLTNFGHRRYSTIISLLRSGGYITDALRDFAMATGDFGQPIKGWQLVREAVPDDEEEKKKQEDYSEDEFDEPVADTELLTPSPEPSPAADVNEKSEVASSSESGPVADAKDKVLPSPEPSSAAATTNGTEDEKSSAGLAAPAVEGEGAEQED